MTLNNTYQTQKTSETSMSESLHLHSNTGQYKEWEICFLHVLSATLSVPHFSCTAKSDLSVCVYVCVCVCVHLHVYGKELQAIYQRTMSLPTDDGMFKSCMEHFNVSFNKLHTPMQDKWFYKLFTKQNIIIRYFIIKCRQFMVLWCSNP